MIEQTRIQTEQIGTRPFETRHMPNTIHIGCWQLWSKIRWWGTCQSSQMGSGRTLQTHLLLDRNTIHRHYIRLELHKPPGKFVNAKLCDESIKTIPTHHQKTSVCTLPVHPNSVWRKEAIRNAGIESTIIRWQGQTIHPTGMPQILIPWQSSGLHPPLPN